MTRLSSLLGDIVLTSGLTVCSLSFADPSEKEAVSATNHFEALMHKILEAWGTLEPAKAVPFYLQEPNAAVL